MPQQYNCESDDGCKLLSKSETNSGRVIIVPVFDALRKILKDDKTPSFSQRLVGSVSRNMTYQHKNSPFDYDYQLDINIGKKYKSLDADLKLTYYNALKSIFDNRENKDVFPSDNIDWSCNISTSVIEVHRTEKIEGFELHSSYDLALIDIVNGKINKGKDNSNTEFGFKWETLPKYSESLNWFRDDASVTNIDEIKQKYLDRKCSNRNIPKDDVDHRSSTQLLVEVINNYLYERE